MHILWIGRAFISALEKVGWASADCANASDYGGLKDDWLLSCDTVYTEPCGLGRSRHHPRKSFHLTIVQVKLSNRIDATTESYNVIRKHQSREKETALIIEPKPSLI